MRADVFLHGEEPGECRACVEGREGGLIMDICLCVCVCVSVEGCVYTAPAQKQKRAQMPRMSA